MAGQKQQTQQQQGPRLTPTQQAVARGETVHVGNVTYAPIGSPIPKGATGVVTQDNMVSYYRPR